MSSYLYVGPAVLRVTVTGRERRFRGRMVRHPETGRYRFVVNRLPSGRRPDEWTWAEEWLDVEDLAAVEWIGKKPDGVE